MDIRTIGMFISMILSLSTVYIGSLILYNTKKYQHTVKRLEDRLDKLEKRVSMYIIDSDMLDDLLNELLEEVVDDEA